MRKQPVSSVTFHATIADSNQHFSVPADRTLLDAARTAGIILPSSCRNGTCRTCRCLLRSGAVHYRIEWPGLSITEKEDGYVLPCVAYPLSDLVLNEPRVSLTPASTKTSPR